MATVTARKTKKPVRTPRPIQVIEGDDDDQLERENERHDHLVAASIELLKYSSQWSAAETEAREGNDNDDFESILRRHFVTVYWPHTRQGVEIRGNSDGVLVTRRDGARAQIYWSTLIDELEECPKTKQGQNETNVHMLEPPGLTGTTTPAGIARHDPDAIIELPEIDNAGGSARNPTEKVSRKGVKPAKADGEEEPVTQATGPKIWTRTHDGMLSACAVVLSHIEPNPYQPRLDFPEEQIAELAASIEAHGQLQRILLRQKPGTTDRFQIADGERRYRAVKKLGRDTILAEVRSIDDSQMAELAIVANDDRKDLTAIERASAYRRMIDEFKLTHEDLAKKLGKSKGYVSNLVRLLDLPAEWQQRVAAGELSPSHAEVLLPFVKIEKLSQALTKAFPPGAVPSAKEFPREVHRSVSQQTKEVTGTIYSMGGSTRLSFTPAQLAELDIVEVKNWNNQTVKRAANVTLWNKIVKEKRGAKKAKGGDKKGKSAAAEKARREHEERERRHKLLTLRARWLNGLIYDALQGRGDLIEDVALRVFFTLAAGGDMCDGPDPWDTVSKVLKVKRSASPVEVWRKLAGGGTTLGRLSLEVARAHFSPRAAAHLDLSDDSDYLLCDEVAASLSIDPAAEFKKNLLGDVTEEWIDLHSEEEIVALMLESGVKVTDRMEFDEAVLALENLPAIRRKLPRELAGAKARGKGSRK